MKARRKGWAQRQHAETGGKSRGLKKAAERHRAWKRYLRQRPKRDAGA